MAISSFILSATEQRLKVSDTIADQVNQLLAELSPHKNCPIQTKDDIQNIIDGGSYIFCLGDFIGGADPVALVAMATLCPQYKLSGLSGVVQDVVVNSKYRGHGEGREIMKLLMKYACELGMQHLDLTSKVERLIANQLYQKLGFKLRATNCYRLNLV